MPPAADDPALRAEFERLHAQNVEAARRFARLKLGAALRRRVDSEDVQQEAYLEAWRAYRERPEVRSQARDGFTRWLGRIVQHQVLKLAEHHVKAGRRSIRREERPATQEDHSATRTPSEILVAAETQARLLRALDKLSKREREVVCLVHFEGLRVAEAAQRMKKTPGATSVLLCEALGKLEKRLGFLIGSKS